MSTLEYESPKQIYCTTLPGIAGQGNFVIETMSGGVTVLTGGFCYVAPAKSKKAPAPVPPTKTDLSSTADRPTASALGRNAASTPNLMIAQALEPPSPATSVRSKKMMSDSKPVSDTSPTPLKKLTEPHVSPKPSPRAATLDRSPEKKPLNELNKAVTLGRISEKRGSQAEAISPKKSPEKSHKTNMKKKCHDLFTKVNKTNSKDLKQNEVNCKEASPKSENIEGRFKKNFLKHLRQNQTSTPAAETIVIANGVSECEETSTEEDYWINKAKLAELERLQQENKDLKQQNADMKAYIDKLLAKVLTHCPDALAADGDLNPLK